MAIYEELNGSNEWNGSVLAIMLLAGALGALLPSWMIQSHWEASEPLLSGDSPTSTSDPIRAASKALSFGSFSQRTFHRVILPVAFAAALGSISLYMFVRSWDLIPSIAFLSLFFASWQFIHVIVMAHLAHSLKDSQDKVLGAQSTPTKQSSADDKHYIAYGPVRFHTDDELDPSPAKDQGIEMDDSSDDELELTHYLHAEPPYSFAIVVILAINVAVQIISQSILFSFLQLELHDACWIYCDLFFATSATLLFYTLTRCLVSRCV